MRYFHSPSALKSPVSAVRKANRSETGFDTCSLHASPPLDEAIPASSTQRRAGRLRLWGRRVERKVEEFRHEFCDCT